jgi:hypothetical protein
MVLLRVYLSFLLLISPYFSSAQTRLRAADLQQDFAILRQAYQQLHPGLYQYIAKEQMDRQFDACQQALDHDQTLKQAFLTIAKLTASIRCGHSQPNFWNQDSTVQRALFDGPTCLPAYARLIGQRFIVTHSVDPQLPAGWEIQQMNGQSIQHIIQRLLPYLRADGANNGKRFALLSITGKSFECFDIFYALLFPLHQAAFSLRLHNPKTGQTKQVQVTALTRQQRKRLMDQQQPQTSLPMAQLTWLPGQIPLLRINSMVDYNTAFDLKGFIDSTFQLINQKKSPYLLIDARELEGGNDQYAKQIAAHLLTKSITIRPLQTTWAYVRLDSGLYRYITNGSWADGWKYRSFTDYEVTSAGQYRSKSDQKPDTIHPVDHPFRGKTFLLTSPMNSSAGFILARLLKQHRLATLVGQTTGGNQKGITAGAVFFVRLPHSGIEVDVPLIGTGYDVAKHLPDAGLQPDWPVELTVQDWVSGKDTPVKTILERIHHE